MIPYALVLLGLALIVIEFYLPGGIMAALGGIFLLAGVVLYAMESASFLAAFLFLAGTIAGILLAIRFALWRIVKAKPDYSIYSDHDQEGFQASGFDKAAVGKKGMVLTDLKPGGFILIEGSKHAAISLSGYIPKGEVVEAVGGQEQSLMVKKLTKHEKEQRS